MGGDPEPRQREITHEKVPPAWWAIHFLVFFPYVLLRFTYELFVMIAFSPLLAKLSGQDEPPPRKLVDEAFSELQERMVPHGFVRSGRKRILSRNFGGAEESIGYSLSKYNERGIRAEFTVWMETSALPASRKIRWYLCDSVFCSETNGAEVLGTEIGRMTVWQYRYAVNLYPEFRRAARVRKAVAKAERTSMAWFEARRRDAQLSSL